MCWMNCTPRGRDHGRSERAASRPDPAMRASDADRQAVIERLRTHTVDGRLTLDEFEARLGEVLDAKTHADLSATLRELPEPPRPAPPVADPSPSRHRSGLPVPVMIVLLVVLGSMLMRHFAVWLIPIGFFLFGSFGRGGGSRVSASA